MYFNKCLKSLFFVIHLVIYQGGFGKLELLPMPWSRDHITSLSQCVATASKHSFKYGVVSVNNLSNNHTMLEETVLKLLYMENLRLLLTRRLNEDDFSSLKIGGVENYIIYVTNETQTVFFHILKDLSTQSQRTKLLITSTTTLQNQEAFIRDCFEILRNGNVVTAIVFLENPGNATKYNMYTWSLYEPTEYSVQSYCSFGTLHGKKSPSKNPTKCCNNCRVKVIYQINPPYVMNADKGFQQSNYVFNQGTDMNLLNMISASLNFDIQYNQSTTFWGDVYANGTATGDMRKLLNSSVDILIGGYTMTRFRYMNFDITDQYTHESLIWCTHNIPKKEKSPNVTSIFSAEIWTLIFSVYVLASLCIWTLSLYSEEESTAYKEIGTSFLYNFAVLMGAVLYTLPRSLGVRYIMILFVIFRFEVSVLYTSYFTSIVSTPRYVQKYSSLKDIYDDNLTTLMIPRAVLYIHDDRDVIQGVPVTLIKQRWLDCVNISWCLEKISTSERHAFCLPKLRMQHAVTERSYKVHCINRDAGIFPVTLVMRKGFPHYKSFNNMLNRILEAGFVFKWQNDIVTAKRKLHELHVTETLSIRLKHFIPICKVFLFGIFGSFVVFFCEIVVYNKPT